MNIELYHNTHKDQKVKGFLDYHYCSELEEVVQYNVNSILEDNYIEDVNYICIYVHGSRVFGTPIKNSDIDFVLFYKGTIKEDSLFNIFAEESIYIEHVKCDFNPICIKNESDIEYYIQKHDIEYYQVPLYEALQNIKLALDDYQDIKDNNSIKDNDIINAEDVIQQRIELDKYTVDLGLPSGTRWCKFNMGCDKRFDYDRYKHEYCDGRSEWFGNLYAWGELDGMKDTYTWSNYKYAEPSPYWENSYNVNKYFPRDGLTHLLPEDDVVQQKFHIHNFKFYIPTSAQAKELIENTYQEWKTNYLGYERLNGMLFRSKINDNTIFFPAAGFHRHGDYQKAGEIGIYQTSDLSEESYKEIDCFWFDDSLVRAPHFAIHQVRCEGMSIRPVIKV